MKIRHVLGAAAMLAAGSAANAVITVNIYTGTAGAAAAATNATIAAAAGLTLTETTTVGAINFNNAPINDSTTSTIGAFLNNPAGLSAATAALTLNGTYFLFTGSTFLHAGANSFVVPHDDGLQLDIGGVRVIDQPGPTAAVSTPFTVTEATAGLYAFTLAYGETAGGPAVLAFAVNGAPVGGTPEPETWALMVAGFGLIGMSMRRRVKTVAA